MSDNDSPSDESAGSARSARGSAADAPAFAGDPPARDDDIGAAVITIEAPDGSIREYELTDDVKARYEQYIQSSFENYDVEWYETWWEGTVLCVEYQGFVRDSEARPDDDDDQTHQSPLAAMMSGMGGVGFSINGGNTTHQGSVPGRRGQPWAPRRRTRQARVNVDDMHSKDYGYEQFDEGLLPIWKTARLDVQERADYSPLAVEDLFVKPWDPENAHDPIAADYDVETDDPLFDVDDYRDHTDSADKTVSRGRRGNNWNI